PHRDPRPAGTAAQRALRLASDPAAGVGGPGRPAARLRRSVLRRRPPLGPDLRVLERGTGGLGPPAGAARRSRGKEDFA
ncbi:hypothetical protein DF186_24445, partial [Enterococcus hirae]